jgi:hypothetical protein
MCYNCLKCDGSGYYGNVKEPCPLVKKPKKKKEKVKNTESPLLIETNQTQDLLTCSNNETKFEIPKRTVFFNTDGEPTETLKLEEGWFWYRGEKIEDVNNVYERFCNWLSKQENNYNGK